MFGMSQFDYLIIVDFATNSLEPFSEEQCPGEIISFPWMVYDCRQGAVCDEQQIFVKPEWDVELTPSALKIPGISPALIENGPYLFDVIEQFENYLYANIVSLHSTFCLLVDGEFPLKSCLLQEASEKGIKLSTHYHQHFDIRKEFLKRYPQAFPVHSLSEICAIMGIPAYHKIQHGLSHCRVVSSVVARLQLDGHCFEMPEMIFPYDDDGISSAIDSSHQNHAFASYFPSSQTNNSLPNTSPAFPLEQDLVVRLRGLPWQATLQDIVQFFDGVHLAPENVVVCVNNQGRPIGEAFVSFSDLESRNLALQRDHTNMGKRYIEVFPASASEMEAARNLRHVCESRGAQITSNHQDSNAVVRLRGLPFSCSFHDVSVFFSGLRILENGIHFLLGNHGKSTGEAFVLFSTQKEANKALNLNRKMIGNRYVEVFHSSFDEFCSFKHRLSSFLPKKYPQSSSPASTFPSSLTTSSCKSSLDLPTTFPTTNNPHSSAANPDFSPQVEPTPAPSLLDSSAFLPTSKATPSSKNLISTTRSSTTLSPHAKHFQIPARSLLPSASTESAPPAKLSSSSASPSSSLSSSPA
eukprot:Sdes_comp18088_c0_seq1m7512